MSLTMMKAEGFHTVRLSVGYILRRHGYFTRWILLEPQLKNSFIYATATLSQEVATAYIDIHCTFEWCMLLMLIMSCMNES